VWLHVLLFCLTAITTTVVGGYHYTAFLQDFRGIEPLVLPPRELMLKGLWYSATILGFLGTHEMGHYFACRYYGVNASLPYFLPAPIALTGTLGAFIRIRQPLRSKRMLFDIGVAGPIAGFLVAVPALFIGLSLSHIARVPSDFTGLSLGEPLLFQWATQLVWGTIPDGYSVNLHPMAFAAWFGLLATALNLFPLGQLDGGHVSYAVLGRRSTIVTLATVAVAVLLTVVYSLSWLVWTVLMVVMLFAFGPAHPRIPDEHVPLDRVRLWLALFALVMFVVCFTPAPVEPLDLLERPNR
jgi:membrane-associated protease RseP (regulator of RpoE activity)